MTKQGVETDPDLIDIVTAPSDAAAQQKLDQYLQSCVSIDVTLINDEFVRIPSDLAYWSARSDDASEEFLRAKDALEKAEATAELAIRSKAATRGEKVTEGIVRACVVTHPLYRDAIEKSIQAESTRNRMRSIVTVIMTKKDMLISAGAHIRAEMQANPAIRDQAAAATAYNPPKGGRRA